MFKKLAFSTMLFAASAFTAPIAMAQETVPAVVEQSFADWLAAFKAEAQGKGITAATLEQAFANVQPVPRVLELDKRQPEFTRTLWVYLKNGVSEARIKRGRALLKKHAALFDGVQNQFGVQPRFLVAFWGLETNFGDYTGGFPVIDALATLAHDPRRADFFRGELMQALAILQAGHIDQRQMLGSWAGAMGQTQFMPSTFTQYAKDGDADKKVDIWNSLPDVMTSSANYLNQIGWKGDQTWGREVSLPDGFDLELVDMKVRKPLADWQALGVRRANGADLPKADMEGSLLLPAGHKGPAFLVYGNFRAIMTWNRSILYALTVGHLADRLAGLGPLAAKQPADDKPLSRENIIALQSALAALGFEPGAADGIMGSRTRNAVKAYQRQNGLPADGYPTAGLVEKLGKAAN